ncbi:MAG: fused isobutyryl-CoA mutase/GTPase IcmF [Bdellovibrionia bacterium]
MSSSGYQGPVRFITAASLFDGHDASINIIRRLLQDHGAEVVHLGHNRSVKDVVVAAVQEGAQGIAISSYQGGHMEYFKYMKDLLVENGAGYVKIFGGGGGVIVHDEKDELEKYGIDRIYHPEDGRRLGLEGMIKEMIELARFDVLSEGAKPVAQMQKSKDSVDLGSDRSLGLDLTVVERTKFDALSAFVPGMPDRLKARRKNSNPPILGLTGTGGAGKSSLCDELLQRFSNAYPGIKIAVLCVDPSKRKTGGALLGDRIRMNSISQNPGIFMRSVASRGSGNEISDELPRLIKAVKGLDFDLIIVETSGIGQSSSAITEVSDISLYVMTSEFGAQSQLEKIDMIDYADFIAINKADHRGSADALRDVRKQYRRSRKLFHEPADEKLPVYLTRAALFNDEGVHQLFTSITEKLTEKFPKGRDWKLSSDYKSHLRTASRQVIIPAERQNYLSMIVKSVRDYKARTIEHAQVAEKLQALRTSMELAPKAQPELSKVFESEKAKLPAADWSLLAQWDALKANYEKDELVYSVRGKDIKQELVLKSLSGVKIRRVNFPVFSGWGDRLRFARLENLPGYFPFTAGVFPLKRREEEPRRQFAGEGTPERTNKRFHYLSRGEPAKRLSTAFDSVTLYGEDPDPRPDIYGKVGESGVSICTVDDIKKLYDGFDLCDAATSVSMTINGPAPMLLAFFMNAAIDQRVKKKEAALGRILKADEFTKVRAETLTLARGTVQADILKEDQAQNTCIFSTDFALKMMGDIQEFFIQNQVRNFYSVSISGYHIAEAGANPISQLAFTLSNGFTYVEYYLSRGMKIDDFAPNLSFFFSNGLDPEYSVLGRVARRIWAIAIRDLYGGNDRSQKLKYHIQTSGRSLHAQEIAFNDIRTTLQALIAIYDHCNSLHTNAYDEAITTPTEESVRRAMAIQMIINQELGATKNENPLQGSFFIEELTDLVEEAVLSEFLRINERGGVLGAMETQYQRGRIQDESLFYEQLKHTGKLPIIGVNTYVDPKTLEAGYRPPRIEMARASQDEKQHQLKSLAVFQSKNRSQAELELEKLKKVATTGGNVFEALMQAARHCSLGEMSRALYQVGGQYRRSM